MNSITVTKIDAARRQLRTAIELWFAEGDPVSIHSLASNAHRIVHDLNRRNKGRELLFDTLIVKDEHRREFVSSITRQANFFKHADRGKAGQAKTTELDPRSTEIFMFVAVAGIQLLGETIDDIETAFVWWNFLHKPRWLRDSAAIRFIESIPINVLEQVRLNKRDFFNTFVETRRSLRSSTH